MMYLSRHTVRQGWPPYVGSAVAMSLGVALMFLTITVMTAVESTMTASGQDREVMAQLEDLSALFGFMS